MGIALGEGAQARRVKFSRGRSSPPCAHGCCKPLATLVMLCPALNKSVQGVGGGQIVLIKSGTCLSATAIQSAQYTARRAVTWWVKLAKVPESFSAHLGESTRYILLLILGHTTESALKNERRIQCHPWVLNLGRCLHPLQVHMLFCDLML